MVQIEPRQGVLGVSFIRGGAMKNYGLIRTMNQLLDVVGASGPNPKDRGPVVVRATLWDGRTLEASYYTTRMGPKWQKPDAETNLDFFENVEPLRLPVQRMLDTGESFVTITGSHDEVCCLEWYLTKE